MKESWPVPQRALRHRPRGAVRAAVAVGAPGSRAAAAVALERDRGQRVRRIFDVTVDRGRERAHSRRPTMRALVVRSGARLAWRDVPTPPDPGPLAAIVAPLAMATCDLDRPLGLRATPFPLPLHLGHECVAEVVAVGDQVRTVSVGDAVVVPFQISCGNCPACRVGHTGNCRRVPPLSMYGFGITGGLWGGAIGDQLAVPYADAMLVPVPAHVEPAAVASAADTLSDAYRHVAPHVERIRRHPDGPRIIIVGAPRPGSVFSGSVPLYAGLIARALLPEVEVLIVDGRPHVREHAERLGLAAVPPAALARRTASLVIDSSAHPRGLMAALRATAPDGYCSSAGMLHATARVPATRMFGRNAVLSIARSHARAVIPDVLDLVAAKRLRPELVTTTLGPFDEAPTLIHAHLLGDDVKTVLVRRGTS